MKLTFFAETAGGAKRMNSLAVPFVEGARKIGFQAEIAAQGIPDDDCDIAVVFGYGGPWAKPHGLREAIIDKMHLKGGIVIGTDIGAFMSWQLERYGSATTYRIALGSPTGAGKYFNANSPPDRWQKMRDELEIEVRDWRNQGSYILFCGQANRGWQYDNPKSFNAWFENEIEEIRRHTDRPIVFRPHPVALRHDHGWLQRMNVRISKERPGRNLFRLLANEWAMITYSSSAAVDTVICGVPTFCASGGCVAAPVCNRNYANIEKPRKYDRDQWLFDFSYTSWYINEIREGIPLRRILDNIAC